MLLEDVMLNEIIVKLETIQVGHRYWGKICPLSRVWTRMSSTRVKIQEGIQFHGDPNGGSSRHSAGGCSMLNVISLVGAFRDVICSTQSSTRW